MTTDDTFISVPSGKVFVKRWVPVVPISAIPVILMHDSLGCVNLWRDFPSVLCERLRRPIVAYDRLGFGQSEERNELPSLRFIDEEAELYFPRIIESLGYQKFDLFGYSVGGAMAAACAARFKDACGSLVMEATQAFVEDRTVQGLKIAEKRFSDPQEFGRLVKYHGSKAKWVLRAWIENWLSPGFAGWSIAPIMEMVTCPVLIIHGDRDEYGSQKFPETIRAHAAGSTEMHILDHCGHVPHREQRDKVLELLLKFLER